MTPSPEAVEAATSIQYLYPTAGETEDKRRRDAAAECINLAIAKAVKDKERMDWLEANGHRISVACWKGEGAESNPWTIHEEFPDKQIAEEDTLREAIDHAMQQHK